MIKKAVILKIINPVLFLLVLIQGLTVLTAKLMTPPEWFWVIHEYNGYAIFAMAILRLILNWNWVKSVLFAKKSNS